MIVIPGIAAGVGVADAAKLDVALAAGGSMSGSSSSSGLPVPL